ncbi:MAG: hypothetical protein A2V84_01175 [Chloroflexi bacterium RBG_16_70_13]|nr:MAG: hypothetical protein A2V84_01175 [Chloroflexi bacterium RBG_16_70_13]
MQRQRLARQVRGRSIAGLLAALAAATWTGGCAGDGPRPSPAVPPETGTTRALIPSAAAPTNGAILVVSSVMPFQLLFPPDWVEYGAGADEQSFGTSDGMLTLIVGRAVIEPGQTVADRVEVNRTTEFRNCSSDASLDRPITIDTEPGILWSVRCGDRSILAANTIHDGRGYRVLVQSTPDAAADLEPLLRAFVDGFRFTE